MESHAWGRQGAPSGDMYGIEAHHVHIGAPGSQGKPG